MNHDYITSRDVTVWGGGIAGFVTKLVFFLLGYVNKVYIKRKKKFWFDDYQNQWTVTTWTCYIFYSELQEMPVGQAYFDFEKKK